ncbi:MAG: HAD family hydrolase [Rhodocyclaceae bacterium]|nr:HAD family hydrolase [Rhodocyclaceae bacterium]
MCFDAFGTLLAFGPGARRANPYLRLVEALARRDGVKPPRLPFMTRNVPIEVFAEELGLAYLTPVLRHELEQDIAGIRVFDDVAPTLAALRSQGRRIAVCSNLAQPYGEVVRRLLPGLDAYVLSFEVGARKPEAAIYQAVCNAFRCAPREVLFIGDSLRADVEGPRRFGMQARRLERQAGQELEDVL